MSRESQESVVVGGSGARERFPPSDGVMEAVWGGAAVALIPSGRRPLRVLVADGYRDAADSLSMLIRLWGHAARVAYDGPAALEITSASQPDVLLLDIALPRMDGYQLAQQLRRQPPFQDTLLVAITGYADRAHRLRGEVFDHYLIKPVEPLALEELLALEQNRLARSPEEVEKTYR